MQSTFANYQIMLTYNLILILVGHLLFAVVEGANIERPRFYFSRQKPFEVFELRSLGDDVFEPRLESAVHKRTAAARSASNHIGTGRTFKHFHCSKCHAGGGADFVGSGYQIPYIIINNPTNLTNINNNSVTNIETTTVAPAGGRRRGIAAAVADDIGVGDLHINYLGGAGAVELPTPLKPTEVYHQRADNTQIPTNYKLFVPAAGAVPAFALSSAANPVSNNIANNRRRGTQRRRVNPFAALRRNFNNANIVEHYKHYTYH